jgi:hypothetical protein
MPFVFAPRVYLSHKGQLLLDQPRHYTILPLSLIVVRLTGYEPACYTDYKASCPQPVRQLKIEKREFNVDTTDFLGFVISPDGIRMDVSKVIQVIKDWPTPRKVKDVQSFLGFANFYRRFIANYSDMSVPLSRLTRKNKRSLELVPRLSRSL